MSDSKCSDCGNICSIDFDGCTCAPPRRFIVLKRENTGESVQIPYEKGWDLKTVEAVCAAIDSRFGEEIFGARLEIFTASDLRNPAYDTSEAGIFDDYSGPDNPLTDVHPWGQMGSFIENGFCTRGDKGCGEAPCVCGSSSEDDETFPPEEADTRAAEFGAGLECASCGEVGCICSDRT